jgi:hypothetical protein
MRRRARRCGRRDGPGRDVAHRAPPRPGLRYRPRGMALSGRRLLSQARRPRPRQSAAAQGRGRTGRAWSGLRPAALAARGSAGPAVHDDGLIQPLRQNLSGEPRWKGARAAGHGGNDDRDRLGRVCLGTDRRDERKPRRQSRRAQKQMASIDHAFLPALFSRNRHASARKSLTLPQRPQIASLPPGPFGERGDAARSAAASSYERNDG